MNEVAIEKDGRRFEVEKFEAFRDELHDYLCYRVDPKGSYTNSRGEKCQLRDAIVHEVNRRLGSLKICGEEYARSGKLAWLADYVFFMHKFGEDERIEEFVSGPAEDWSVVNRVVGICHVVENVGLCEPVKITSENEIEFKDLDAEIKGWWYKSRKERYGEDVDETST